VRLAIALRHETLNSYLELLIGSGPQTWTSTMRQIDLFSNVLHSYAGSSNSPLTNSALYTQVADRAGINPEEFDERVPVGVSGQRHSLLKRKVRWHQMTMKAAGILEHVERGVWRLTTPATKELNQINSGVSLVGFSTDLGVAILGSCDTVFSKIDAPVVLVLTSPPYPLAKPRAYGNVSEASYVDWIVDSRAGGPVSRPRRFDLPQCIERCVPQWLRRAVPVPGTADAGIARQTRALQGG